MIYVELVRLLYHADSVNNDRDDDDDDSDIGNMSHYASSALLSARLIRDGRCRNDDNASFVSVGW